jgi:hypothetical protein
MELEVKTNNLRLKRGNTFIKITKYIISNLILDLINPQVKIEVELYKDDLLVDTRYIYFSETTGEVNVDNLIIQTKEILSNGEI